MTLDDHIQRIRTDFIHLEETVAAGIHQKPPVTEAMTKLKRTIERARAAAEEWRAAVPPATAAPPPSAGPGGEGAPA